MRTTVDLPDGLLRELKARAALEGISLKQLVLSLVERGLQTPAVQAVERTEMSTLPTLDFKHPLGIRNFSNADLFDLLDA